MQAKPKPRTQVAIPDHPGLAYRGDRIIVRNPAMKGRPSSFRTVTEALREQTLRRSRLVAPQSNEPFDEYARRWVKVYRGRTSRPISEETREHYAFSIELAIAHFGRKALGKIKPTDVRAYVQRLREGEIELPEREIKRHGRKVERKGRTLKASSIRKHVAPLRAMFAELVEDGALPSNPATVRIIATGERRKRKPKVVTPEQTRAVMENVPEALRDLVFLIALTGLRIGEAVALKWRDVERDEDGAPILRLRRIATDNGIRERVKHRDEGDETQTVALSPALARRLLARRASATFAGEDDFIFATENGTPVDRHNVRRAFRPAAEKAGVPWATPHTLRHSIASLLYEQGWTDHQVAALLRHEDPTFTRRVYVHPVTRGDVSILDDVFELPE